MFSVQHEYKALTCGCPVVSTDCPSGPAEILENGKYGLLVPPENPEKLAEAILRVLRDQNLAEELRKKGPERARDFTVDRAVEEYVRVIEECRRS